MVVESRKRHQMRHLDVLYRLLRDQEVGASNPLAPIKVLEVRVIAASFLLATSIHLRLCTPITRPSFNCAVL